MEGQGDTSDYRIDNEEKINAKGNVPINGGECELALGSAKRNRMLHKTKPCFMFRAGNCPFAPNCKFAHGLEELKKPAPDWQEIVGDNEIHKSRHIKRPRDDQSIPRESAAIVLRPTTHGDSLQRSSYWKTRICNRWQEKGHCSFGDMCRFAHGFGDLQKHSEDRVGTEAGIVSSAADTDLGQSGEQPKPGAEVGSCPAPSGIINVSQSRCEKSLPKWRGPDKISRIYGDWIDEDDECHISRCAALP